MIMDKIKVESLAVAYEDKIIIESLDLELPKGKVSIIIGPNGCGKSTVLKTIGRLLKPQAGAIYIEGINIQVLSTKEIAKEMAILPQSPTAPAGLTVFELISYGRFPHQKNFGKLTEEDQKIIHWALEVTGLESMATQYVDCLSGGQRQRVWIAMALAQQTDTILLDEPTTYLDMSYQLEILELLEKLNREQGCTVVMVLHDLNLAARFAHYMIAMREGQIIAHGEPDKVMTKAVIRETFGIDAKIIKEEESQRLTCVTYDLIKENKARQTTSA